MKLFAGLATSLILLMTLIFLHDPFASIDKDLRAARQAAASAIQEAQAGLTGVASQLQTDTTFLENLAGGLENSSHQFLEGHVRAGVVDTIRVYSDSCTPLLVAPASGHLKASGCDPKDSGRSKFSWLDQDGLPVLQQSTPVTDSQGRRYILATQLLIHDKWLAAAPALQKFARPLRLDIMAQAPSSPDTYVIHAEPAGADGVAATVISRHWMAVYLWNYLHVSVTALKTIIVLLALLAIGLTFAAASRFRSLSWQVKRDIETLGKWVDQLTLDPFALPDPRKIFDRPLKALTGALGQHLESLEAMRRDQGTSIRQLQDEVLTLKGQLRLKDVEMEQYKELKSLAAQMQNTTDGFIANLAELNDMFENLSDILTHGMKKHTQSLCQFTAEWQKNLKESSARKYFRNLSERVYEDGDNELNRELERLFAVSHAIGTQSINLALQTQKIRQRLEKATQQAAHWQTLSVKDPTAKTGGLLVDLVREGENLLMMVPDLPKLGFRRLFDETLSVHELPVPRAVWSSAFFHLQMALVEIARSCQLTDLEIQTRVRHRKRQTLMVFSLALDPGATVQTVWPLPAAAQEQIDLANALLHPHKIRVTPLPTVKDLPPLAVVWDSMSEEGGRGMTSPELTL